MFKNVYTRLGLISSIVSICLLIALPRIPIKSDNKWLKVDSFIGGYAFELFNGRLKRDFSTFKTGLDLSGGVRIVLRAELDEVPEEDRDAAVESAVEVIERRINLLGVTEPYIAVVRVGEERRIVVEIPGLENVTDAIALIGETAQIKFMVLKEDAEWSVEKYEEFYLNPAVWEETGVTGADLRGANVIFGSGGGVPGGQNRPQIQISFTKEGLDKFSEVAKKNIDKPVAIFLDDEVAPISMAVVDKNLAEGLVEDPIISGSFTLEGAQALSVQIRAGALPISISVMEQKSIGATLGQESVSKSFFAGVVGFGLVLIFMVYMYKRFGILASFSLVAYTIIVMAVFKLIPVVLTLPGIAGLVLSIGMASDANILIFERIKEEMLWGKPDGLAIKHGFERAWTSIRDSNISSLITAFILFQFGSGPVRGFALTLAVGILASLFTSIFVVRTLIEAFNIGGYRSVKK
ncbi:protein translocase subunit SecD [Patescibacteria group bacterium]